MVIPIIKFYKPGPAEFWSRPSIDWLKEKKHLNQNFSFVFTVLVLVFVRQGRELAVYQPTCLKVGDKTWQRSTQDDWKLRTGLTACHPRWLKVKDKILHRTIMYNPRWLKVKDKNFQHSIKHVWKSSTKSNTVTSKMLESWGEDLIE